MLVMELTEEASSGSTDFPRKVCTDSSEANGGGGGDDFEFDEGVAFLEERSLLDLEDLEVRLLLALPWPSFSKL